METKDTHQNFIKQLKKYLETRFKLLKCEAIEEGSSIISGIITDVIMIVIFTIAFILFSVTIALLLGKLLESNWLGFACVTVLYLLIAMFHRIFKISIENVLIRIFIQKLFKQGNVKSTKE